MLKPQATTNKNNRLAMRKCVAQESTRARDRHSTVVDKKIMSPVPMKLFITVIETDNKDMERFS